MRAKAGYGLETITTATAMALAKNKSHPNQAKPSQAKTGLEHEDNMPRDSSPAGNPVEQEGYM